ncbi:MAG: cation transporting ATPase C-terminal domain-containing protein [Candidatus Scalindua sp.]|jgi:magnesium-transporting ATPase (P-type)|nr:cation transporting ATPase C-terminal domain-containing protein [Candidatus Scalindua sp.]MDV5167167.1 cation transporting ATPase C-terminal domain-containing protein [Candidatus Scalindua sp.]
MENQDDTELIRLAREGDSVAFEELVERNYTFVYKISYKWTGIKEDAEDITQNVFMSALNSGVPLERARTAALTTMVFFQFYQALNCRSETESIFRMNPMSNPFLFYAMIAALFAQLAVLYVPALQWIFRTVPLTMTEWLEVGLVTVTVVIAVEIDKWIRRKKLS